MPEEKKKYKKLECPFCHAKIDHLIEQGKESVYVTYLFYGNGESEDQETDFNYYGDIFPREYTCPECGKVISTDREKAQKFLQTGKLD